MFTTAGLNYFWQNADGTLAASSEKPEGITTFLTQAEYLARLEAGNESSKAFFEQITGEPL